MTDQEKEITQEEARKLVNEIAKELYTTMAERVSHIKDKQRWYVFARVINTMFGWFYNPLLRKSEELAESESECVK